jgi:hypothetical protein
MQVQVFPLNHPRKPREKETKAEPGVPREIEMKI